MKERHLLACRRCTLVSFADILLGMVTAGTISVEKLSIVALCIASDFTSFVKEDLATKNLHFKSANGQN